MRTLPRLQAHCHYFQTYNTFDRNHPNRNKRPWRSLLWCCLRWSYLKLITVNYCALCRLLKSSSCRSSMCKRCMCILLISSFSLLSGLLFPESISLCGTQMIPVNCCFMLFDLLYLLSLIHCLEMFPCIPQAKRYDRNWTWSSRPDSCQ